MVSGMAGQTATTTRVLLATIVAALGLSVAIPAHAQEPVRPVVVEVDDGGFHWRDALIGAFGVAGFGLAISGVVVLFRRREGGARNSYPPQSNKGGM
jgi:hypothetical protein